MASPSPGPSTAEADATAEDEVAAPGGDDGNEEAGAGLEPCQALLGEACALLGPHSEECAEAKAAAPGARVPEHAALCAEVLERWRPLVAADSRGNPCKVLATRKCEALGEKTRTCQDARALALRIRGPEQRRACGGDLLLWEVRAVLSGP